MFNNNKPDNDITLIVNLSLFVKKLDKKPYKEDETRYQIIYLRKIIEGSGS